MVPGSDSRVAKSPESPGLGKASGQSKEDIQDEGMATTTIPKIPASSDLMASYYPQSPRTG